MNVNAHTADFELVFCKDCEFYGRGYTIPDVCLNKNTQLVDLVRGTKERSRCNDARSEKGACGIQGRYFSKK